MIQVGLVLLAISAIAALFFLPWPFVATLITGTVMVIWPVWAQERRNQQFETARDRRRSRA